MSCFGETAARLCGVASQLLTWRPDEFWNSTPAELALALTVSAPIQDAPDRLAIDELKRRFPDQ